MSQWVRRHYDRKSQGTDWTIKGPLKKYDELLSQRTRENGLMLSRAADLNIQEISEPFPMVQEEAKDYRPVGPSFLSGSTDGETGLE